MRGTQRPSTKIKKYMMEFHDAYLLLYARLVEDHRGGSGTVYVRVQRPFGSTPTLGQPPAPWQWQIRKQTRRILPQLSSTQ